MLTAIINKSKPCEGITREELKSINRSIEILRRRVNYINKAQAMFSKWQELELVNVTIDKELLQYGEPTDYIGKGYIEGVPIYFTKSELVSVAKLTRATD